MVNFLLLIEKTINYKKKDIDKGSTPLKIYELCSCIRETFCLSYSIRKNNNLFLYFQDKYLLVKFLGNKLRYLGPDERSQALLLEKALSVANEFYSRLDEQDRRSTPGIYVSKFIDFDSLLNHFKLYQKRMNYFIIDWEENAQEKIEIYPVYKSLETIEESDFFIIPTFAFTLENSGFFHPLRVMKNIKYLSLSKIKQIENKILYINFRKDHRRFFQEKILP